MRKLTLSALAAAAALALLASFAPPTGSGSGDLSSIDPAAITLAGPALQPTAQPDAF